MTINGTKQYAVMAYPGEADPILFGPFASQTEAEEWELPPGLDADDDRATVVALHEPVTWFE